MAANAPDTPLILTPASQRGLIEFYKANASLQAQHWNIKNQMREIDLLYMREKDWTTNNKRAQIANRYGDADKLDRKSTRLNSSHG